MAAERHRVTGGRPEARKPTINRRSDGRESGRGAARRNQPLYWGAVAIVVGWALCWGCYTLAKRSRMTAAKVTAYQNSLDLERMTPEQRRKALEELLKKLNRLSAEERSRWHFDRDWFRQLTEEEKERFIDGFLPGEMKRALAEFEKMPKERQQKDIDDALRELRQHAASGRRPAGGRPGETNGPLVSPDLDRKIRVMGLNAVYGQSSAQTKAELAPLLLEVQRQMEGGQLDLNGY